MRSYTVPAVLACRGVFLLQVLLVIDIVKALLAILIPYHSEARQ